MPCFEDIEKACEEQIQFETVPMAHAVSESALMRTPRFCGVDSSPNRPYRDRLDAWNSYWAKDNNNADRTWKRYRNTRWRIKQPSYRQ